MLVATSVRAYGMPEEQAEKATPNIEKKVEQKEKAINTKDTGTTDTDTDKQKTEPVEIAEPISLELQQKNDINHYLANEKIKPILAGPDDYLTLVTKNSSPNNKGVAILLPDWQQRATSPKAINFLRKALPKQGWTTITIQPANKPNNYPSESLSIEDQQKENDQILNSYQAKLSVMISAVMAKAKDYPGIVIVIAQGNNGAMLADLYSQEKNKPANALILLSSYRQTSHGFIDSANEDFAQSIATSDYPVLDLTLKHDHPIVISKTAQRVALAKQEMKIYYRHRLLNNSMTGYYPETELLSQINSWLKSIGW